MNAIEMKKLIKKNIVDFTELVLNNYQKIGLDETDAVIVIKLHYLLQRNITFISPTKLADMLSISAQTTSKRLNTLIDKGYIKIKIIKKNNKESEQFDLDALLEAIVIADLKDDIQIQNEVIKTEEGSLVTLFEEEFKKPLKPLDIQIITKWLQEDKFTFEQIKDALFTAVKNRKLSIQYVDGILLKQEEETPKHKKTSIKDLKKLWEE